MKPLDFLNCFRFMSFFKVYASSLALKNSGAVYLTQKSTTPRTFLQPGAMVDAGRGPIDVWATIEQRQPGKMYITLGTNALMAMDPQAFADSYAQLIDKVREYTPDTLIYVTTITPTFTPSSCTCVSKAKPQLMSTWAARNILNPAASTRNMGIRSMRPV